MEEEEKRRSGDAQGNKKTDEKEIMGNDVKKV